ncbi:MAG: hypothetical protein AAGI49_07885 [Bacteroidota bacterium]
MAKPIKYDEATAEAAYLKMYSGLTASTKAKIAKARKFPKEAMKSYDLFKTYFLSAEGLAGVIKKLSEEEIVVLHILSFNQWIVDVSFLEEAYVPMPELQKWGRYGTFTQKYGSLLKTVHKNLVQNGLLVQYEDKHDGDSKTARQRFLFPAAFTPYLPSPFFKSTKIGEKGTSNDESIKAKLLKSIRSGGKKAANTLVYQNRKLYYGDAILNAQQLDEIKLSQWNKMNGTLIMRMPFMNEGEIFSAFILHHLANLPSDQWLPPNALSTLMRIWEGPIKRKDRYNGRKGPVRYEETAWCEAGWKNGMLQKVEKSNKSYYRLVGRQEQEVAYDQYLSASKYDILSIDFEKAPLPLIPILAQISFFNSLSDAIVKATPDLVHIADMSAALWGHPLIEWLEKNVPSYKAAFGTYRKKYGKEIIHDNLLIAKITDLSLRVLVEKALQKEREVVVLSEEYLAFPKAALAKVERIVAKSGNVIKNVS